VWISFGVAELGVYPIHHQIGYRMFEDFCLVVDLVPAVPEFANEVGLDEAMSTDHADGRQSALLGE
jgi:hypothetical protein